MRIVTNFERFPPEWRASNGTVGFSEFAQDRASFLRYGGDSDAVFVVNCDPRLVLALARARVLGRHRRPVVAVDLVLRDPKSVKQRILAIEKRFALRQVDLFLHYFKDFAGIDERFGIGGSRADFVDFKANLWDRRVDGPRPEGDYVLCFGRSLRDYDTFFEAVELADVPAAIVEPRLSQVRAHGSRFSRSLESLPPNVRILHDDLSDDSQASLLSNARIVAVPLVRGSLVASGISTILNAMVLGKCVVASEGPGVSDLFDREVLQAPPEDARSLAAVLRRAWDDEQVRRTTAEAGWKYGIGCGSERDLFQRILDKVAARASLHGGSVALP